MYIIGAVILIVILAVIILYNQRGRLDFSGKCSNYFCKFSQNHILIFLEKSQKISFEKVSVSTCLNAIFCENLHKVFEKVRERQIILKYFSFIKKINILIHTSLPSRTNFQFSSRKFSTQVVYFEAGPEPFLVKGALRDILDFQSLKGL